MTSGEVVSAETPVMPARDRSSLRVAAWNCRRAMDRKRAAKVVQARLGHATAAETLDNYSHLWPDSDDQTREAITESLIRPVADYLRTGEAP